MVKVIIYLVLSLAINCMVVGEPFRQLASSRFNLDALIEYYEHLSGMQILVIGICEFILIMFLLPGHEVEAGKNVDDNEEEIGEGDEKELKNE